MRQKAVHLCMVLDVNWIRGKENGHLEDARTRTLEACATERCARPRGRATEFLFKRNGVN